MDNYSDQLPNEPWQAFFQTPRPVDTVRNADYDKAMGYDEQPGDSWGVKFAKGLQSSLSRNTPEGRQLTQDIAKQKIANQLAMQLKQQQYDFAQTHPTFSHFMQTPYGGIVALDPTTGQSKTVMDNVPGMAEAKMAENKALLAKATTESSPEYQKNVLAEQQGKVSELAARTNYYNSMPGIEQAKIDYLKGKTSALENPQPKPKAITEQDAQKQAAFELIGAYPGSKQYDRQMRMKDEDGSMTRRINDRAQQIMQENQSHSNTKPSLHNDPSALLQSVINSPF